MTCEFPSSKIDPGFWDTFTEQARTCKYARKGDPFTIPYENKESVDASLMWVKAYKECLDDVNCCVFYMNSATQADIFRGPDVFLQTVLESKGYGHHLLHQYFPLSSHNNGTQPTFHNSLLP